MTLMARQVVLECQNEQLKWSVLWDARWTLFSASEFHRLENWKVLDRNSFSRSWKVVGVYYDNVFGLLEEVGVRILSFRSKHTRRILLVSFDTFRLRL